MSAAAATAPPGITGVMWKTVSEDCNLACDYCYYSTCGGRPGARRRIPLELLETAIRKYMEHSRGTAAFAWQGGEPLLAGLEFFEGAIALQVKHAPPNTTIGNALQTNGTLLTGDWARFFRRYHFLVGVSVDGPREIHDAHRVTATGKGSFDLVMRRIGHLRDHDVDFNILTVLHQGNVHKPRELMAFYEREGFGYVQFIPGMDYRRFMRLKEELPQQCRRCRHLALCYGGCPRSRARDTAGLPAGPDYFCSAYRRFFDHAHERMTLLARKLRARWLVEHARSGRPWPGRNDACTCGSGAKFKRCCAPLQRELGL